MEETDEEELKVWEQLKTFFSDAEFGTCHGIDGLVLDGLNFVCDTVEK